MAKPKVRSAEIASLLGSISGGGGGGGGGGGVGGGGRAEGAGAEGRPAGGESGHPVRDRLEAGVSRADNALVLHPNRVAQRGTYVRPFTEDGRFRELVGAIQEAGNVIHVPILVRVEGEPGAVEYVLVDGTHRLEAARRLGISVPAVNLGRIPPARALAIQAMANEVRAAMHVVDQATYVTDLSAQGLSRDAVQRTTGFSAGRVSELLSIGGRLEVLSEDERTRARQADGVTHRALRVLKGGSREEFRTGVLALVEASEAAANGEEQGIGGDGGDRGVGGGALKGSAGLQERVVGEVRLRRSRRPDDVAAGKSTEQSGVTFVPTKNERGTSVTYRIAWRARAVRDDPEAFLTRIGELLRTIAEEATTQYEAAVNPMPAPHSQRPPGELSAIDPRLLSGLSLPMLTRRIVKRT